MREPGRGALVVALLVVALFAVTLLRDGAVPRPCAAIEAGCAAGAR